MIHFQSVGICLWTNAKHYNVMFSRIPRRQVARIMDDTYYEVVKPLTRATSARAHCGVSLQSHNAPNRVTFSSRHHQVLIMCLICLLFDIVFRTLLVLSLLLFVYVWGFLVLFILGMFCIESLLQIMILM